MEYNNYLYHHGIKGQKWGIRRYQNPDGSLTALGKKKIKVREDFLDKDGNLTEYGKKYHSVYDVKTNNYRDAKSIEDIAASERDFHKMMLNDVKENYEWHKKNRDKYDDQDIYDSATAEYENSIKQINKILSETMSQSVKRVRAELRESDKRKVDDAVQKYYNNKVTSRKLMVAAAIGAACIGGKIYLDKWTSSK